MRDLLAALVVGVPVLLVLGLFGVAIVSGWRRKRQDRRRIMAGGEAGHAVVTKIGDTKANGQCLLFFAFQPSGVAHSVNVVQRTTRAAIDTLGIMVGSNVEVCYLSKWPKWAFVGELTLAERGLPVRPLPSKLAVEPPPKSGLFYVSYGDPANHGAQTSAANSYRWYGSGDVAFLDSAVRFTANRQWRSRPVQREFARDMIVNVEQLGSTVRFEVTEPEEKRRRIQIWAVNDDDAVAIASMLPSKRTETFVPVLAERSSFASTLLQVTPQTPVTPALIAVNVLMFVIAAALGGGLLVADPTVMIRLGTDYTPLTLGGQWWRLLTSTFLHFGLLHIALNMWALYVNGLVAERIFGSVRYLVIYIVAGLTGSVASLLWHPIVNGAGASGAIFGVLGALIAFFFVRKGGVPASVVNAQRASAGAFVVYSLLNGARYGGIDNAAHVGGLAGGFIMGLILARPLDVARNAKPWTGQWAVALSLVGSASVLLSYMFATGLLTPRLARDSNGNPIPIDGLVAPTQSLGGFQLGMSADEALRKMGQPIHRTEAEWDYNSIDAAHDGVLSIEFKRQGQGYTDSVFAIEFFGDRDAAPSEMPYLKRLTTAEIIRKYGEPYFREPSGNTTFLWFRNGVFVGVRNDKVYRYGIFNPALFRSR
jgi:membrane associated rhomboid family serine protease